jgi:uroporphyrinogen-III decarboxylase
MERRKKMSSRERILTAINLKEPDIVPLAPYIGSWYAPKLCGLSISDYTLGSNRDRARILLEAQRRYGYDWIMVEPGQPYGWRKTVTIRDVGRSYVATDKYDGTTKILPKDDAPHTPFGGHKFEDIERIPIQDYRDILRSGALEPVEIVSKKVGREVLVSYEVACPWSTSRRWIGLIDWIKALYRSPDLPEKVMKHAFEINLEFAKAAVQGGAEALWLEEGSVGTDTISPALYERFPFAYECSFIKKLRELGVRVIFSVTGNIMPILDRIVETNADAYHFEESKKGFTIDIYLIRERLKSKKCFFVPFDQINLLRSGSRESVRNIVTEILSRIAPGGGMVLSTGSPVLRDTPVANFRTMIKVARIAGAYPIRV